MNTLKAGRYDAQQFSHQHNIDDLDELAQELWQDSQDDTTTPVIVIERNPNREPVTVTVYETREDYDSRK